MEPASPGPRRLKPPFSFLSNEPIDWSRIGRAVEFYRSRGFTYVEVPWVVPREITEVTLPKGGIPFCLKPEGGQWDSDLVGSAEQSFLWMSSLRILPFGGKFVGVSPCFRSDSRTRLHQQTFHKVELYAPTLSLGDPETRTLSFLEEARSFFESEGLSVESEKTALGTDLLSRSGIEVGSYGSRTWGGISWTYGTGLAEPRFSQALKG